MRELAAHLAHMLYLSIVFALVIAFNIAAIWLLIEFGPVVLDYLLT